eukprot:m.217270 g.217270  ORF g.217270 m.217270 type:complete len:163 (+) comp54106_c0_seq9:779-1267(+)
MFAELTSNLCPASSSVLETFQLPSMLLLLQVWIHRSLSVIWLSVSKKCKGAFFHSNVLSKVALDSSNGVLFSNRAACHLKLGDSHACAEDCTKALALLTPPVPANLKSRVNALTRRATALVSLGDQLSGSSFLPFCSLISAPDPFPRSWLHKRQRCMISKRH